MYPLLLTLALAVKTPPAVTERLAKLSFTWAVELTLTEPDGTRKQQHYFATSKGMMRMHGPEDWVCAFKVDEMRVADMSGQTVFFQNAFIGCMAPGSVIMNTGANISVIEEIISEHETNLTYGKNNEYSARLIPCVNSYAKLCGEWKDK